MEVSHPVEIFLDTEYYWEHQIVLNEAGVRSTLKGPLRNDEGWIGRNLDLAAKSMQCMDRVRF